MPTATIQAFIVTEDLELGSRLTESLRSCAVEASTLAGEAAAKRIAEEIPDFIVADLDLKATDPMAFLRRARDRVQPEQCLLLAGPDSLDRAAEAAAIGLAWYQKKPVGPIEVRIAVQRARSAGGFGRFTTGELLGSSPGIQSALKLATQVAPQGGHLLVVGEPGVGKRLLARLIHVKSRRAHQAFRYFSCEGLSERVVEGELFGRDDGHGDGERVDGILRQCHQGTLVIDEISALPVQPQEHLLKCLTMKTIRPHGGRGASAPADVRIIAASSRSLEECVADGRFSRELFERLGGVCLELPPLRARKSDIPMLADHFARRAAELDGRSFKGVAQDGLDRLMRHDWPGNIRELEDMITRAVRHSGGPWLDAESMPSLPDSGNGQSTMIPGSTIQQIEKDAILKTIDAAGGSTGRAARILNMSVRKIQYKLKEYRREAAATLKAETVRAPAQSAPASPSPVPKRKTVFVAKRDRRD